MNDQRSLSALRQTEGVSRKVWKEGHRFPFPAYPLTIF